MTLDNQTAFINIGQQYPIVSGVTITATGLATQAITSTQVGVQITVTPKIMPDGRVLMRIIPEVSSVNPTPVALGGGNLSTALNIQRLETTVVAADGETIVLGGMISRLDTKNENRVPWLGDLPGIGTLFRYRTQSIQKTELIVVVTPHVVRCPGDAEFIWGVESKKMDWVLPNVVKIQGTAPPHGPVPVPSPARHFIDINVQPQGTPPLSESPLIQPGLMPAPMAPMPGAPRPLAPATPPGQPTTPPSAVVPTAPLPMALPGPAPTTTAPAAGPALSAPLPVGAPTIAPPVGSPMIAPLPPVVTSPTAGPVPAYQPVLAPAPR